MIYNYLKVAFRNLARQKTYTIINILGLSVGLSCALLIMLWVQDELNFDAFHEKLPDICRVVGEYDGIRTPTTGGPMSAFLKADIPEIIDATRFKNDHAILRYGEKSLRLEGINAEPAFLDIFTFPTIKGDCRKALDDPGKLVLTKSAAQKLFGNEEPVGKTVTMANKWEFMVGGVVEDVPANSSPPLKFEYLAPFKIYYFWRDPDSWNANSDYQTWVQLAPTASLDAVNGKVMDLIRRYNPDPKLRVFLQPLSGIHLRPNTHRWDGPHSDIKYVLIFSLLALVMLSIACINFINLATAQSMVREKEIGIRKIIGARRWQIFSLGFTESLLLTVLAIPVTMLIVELALPAFNQLAGKNLVADYTARWFLLNSGLIILFTGLLAGIYPALFLSGLAPGRTLQSSLQSRPDCTRTRKRPFLRHTLVTVQFALAIIAIACTLIIAQQLNFVRNTNLGFEHDNLIYLTMGNNYGESNFTSLKTELKRMPEVARASYSNSIPTEIDFIPAVKWKENEEQRTGGFATFQVDADYLNTMGIKLRKGRFFNDKFPTDKTEAVVVNEAAVKALGLNKPLGEPIEISDRKGRIIGVVQDFHFETFRDEIEPLFLIFASNGYLLNVRIHSGDFQRSLSNIEKLVGRHFPGLPFEWHFLDEQIDRLYQADRRMMQIFAISSLLSICITCLGLSGLVSFVVQLKTKEIGIRKVLGASVRQIIALLSRDAMKLFVLSNLIAWPVTYYFMNRWLQDFAYRIHIGWWVFVLAGGLTLMIALLTVSWQAFRAATANPVESLRYE